MTHLAVAFDNPIRSFRNDLFPSTKRRRASPRELLDQFDPAEDDARARRDRLVDGRMGGRRRARDRRRALPPRRFDQVRILSPDKDLGQCLRDPNVVQVDRIRERKSSTPRRFSGVAGSNRRASPTFSPSSATPPTASPGSPASARRPRRRSSVATAPRRHPQARRRLGAPGPRRREDRGHADERREDALLYKKLATLVEDVPLPRRPGRSPLPAACPSRRVRRDVPGARRLDAAPALRAGLSLEG